MPKIALRYVGDDEALKAKLQATQGLQYFEPVDAREVIASGNRDYEPDEGSRKLMGTLWGPSLRGNNGAGNAPQLQGDDAELQTGISADKYARSQVVKAIPDAMLPTTGAPQSTVGRPLKLDDIPEGGMGAGTNVPRVDGNPEGNGPSVPLSEGMTRDEIKAELQARNVEFDSGAKKDELAELLNAQAKK